LNLQAFLINNLVFEINIIRKGFEYSGPFLYPPLANSATTTPIMAKFPLPAECTLLVGLKIKKGISLFQT
jgi:hypothetical protein